MIYADNAATTKMSKTAIDAMLPYMEEYYGNPSSLYAFAQKQRKRWRMRGRGSQPASARSRGRSISPPAAAKRTTRRS